MNLMQRWCKIGGYDNVVHPPKHSPGQARMIIRISFVIRRNGRLGGVRSLIPVGMILCKLFCVVPFSSCNPHRARHVTSCKGVLPLTFRECTRTVASSSNFGNTAPSLGPGTYNTTGSLERKSYSRDTVSGFGGAKLDRSGWTRAYAGSTPGHVPVTHGTVNNVWVKPTFNKVLLKSDELAKQSRLRVCAKLPGG